MATSITSNQDIDADNVRPKKKPAAAARRHAVTTSRGLKSQLAAEPSTFWHRSVAGQFKGAAAAEGTAWPKLGKYFAQRKSPLELSKLCGGKTSPLLWGCSGCDFGPDDEWVAALDPRSFRKKKTHKISPEEFQSWLVEAGSAQPTVALGIESLAVCHALPRLASYLDAGLWWDLIEVLYEIVSEARTIRPIWDGPEQSILAQQLLAGELPASLGYCFPEIVPLRALRESASETISSGLDELLDGEGLPRARHLGVLQPLFACWTRCRAMADDVKKLRFSSDADIQYQWLVRQVVRLLRSDGSQVFTKREAGIWSRDLLRKALECGGDDADHAAAAKSLPAGICDVDYDDDELPDTSINSEWSGLAVLNANWSKSSPRLAVSYDDVELRIDLVSAGTPLLVGEWGLEVTADGKIRAPEDTWEELCWFSDEDVDYLELAIDLADDLRVERQILLARHDQVVVLVDNVISDRVSDLNYVGTLPLADRIKARPEKNTREMSLEGTRPWALVMPLALPEWRTDTHTGELEAAEETLRLSQRARGRSLSCPLFIDLRRRRLDKQRTWRQLTVAEHRVVQPKDVAVGFRAQSGNQQWLFYRSLVEPANRTVLGQNTSSECLVARFLNTGTIEELLEIEAE